MRANPNLILIVIVLLALIAVGGVLFSQDSHTIAIVMATIVPTVTSLLAMLKASDAASESRNNATKLEEVRVQINGGTSQLMDRVQQMSHTQGVTEGKAQQVADQAAEAARKPS